MSIIKNVLLLCFALVSLEVKCKKLLAKEKNGNRFIISTKKNGTENPTTTDWIMNDYSPFKKGSSWHKHKRAKHKKHGLAHEQEQGLRQGQMQELEQGIK